MLSRRVATVVLMTFAAFSGGAFMTWVLNDQPAYAQYRPQTAPMIEYKRISHTSIGNSDAAFQEAMSECASDGWELIQINEGPQYSNQIISYWKRSKKELDY